MPIQTIGVDGSSILSVDPTQKAAHVSIAPSETDGSFLLKTVATISAAASSAGANIFALRWQSSTRNMLIRRFRMDMMMTIASTSGVPEAAAYIGRSYSTSPSSGNSVTWTGVSQKRRATLQVTDFLAVSAGNSFNWSTGGGLTLGTVTLDSQPFLSLMVPLALGPMSSAEFGGAIEDNPIVLAQNEGIVVQNLTVVSTGNYRFSVGIEWDEVPTANW